MSVFYAVPTGLVTGVIVRPVQEVQKISGAGQLPVISTDKRLPDQPQARHHYQSRRDACSVRLFRPGRDASSPVQIIQPFPETDINNQPEKPI